MPAISCAAPGKVILFGEHAVVYNRPAIAVPVTQVHAKAFIQANPTGVPGKVNILAPDIGLTSCLNDLPDQHPIRSAITGVMSYFKLSALPAFDIKITSTIPIAAGLGSGAAVAVAIIRAVSTFIGHPLSDPLVCDLAFQVEKIHHGTPSGIDNTTITYERPIYYQSGAPMELLKVKAPFTLVIGDTGIRSSTKETVSGVRFRKSIDPNYYDTLFDDIHRIVLDARHIIEIGEAEELGPLMNENHHLLRAMRVSSDELENLVDVPIKAGAFGAKLSGGGGGGNMIALVPLVQAGSVANALREAGAVRTIITTVNTTLD